MSHRIIIYSAIRATFADADVQAEVASKLPPAQCSRITDICASENEPCDEDFRFLTRKLNQLYTDDD